MINSQSDQQEETIEQKYQDLTKIHDTLFNEKTRLASENQKLGSELKSFRENYKQLEVFRDLDPTRVDEYLQAESILKNKADADQSIEQRYKKLVADTKNEYEAKLNSEKQRSAELAEKFNNYRKQNLILESIEGLKDGAPKQHLINLLSSKFDFDETETLVFSQRPMDSKTGEKISVKQAIDLLRDDPEFSFYFSPKTANGSGATGSSGQYGTWSTTTDRAELWKNAKSRN